MPKRKHDEDYYEYKMRKLKKKWRESRNHHRDSSKQNQRSRSSTRSRCSTPSQSHPQDGHNRNADQFDLVWLDDEEPVAGPSNVTQQTGNSQTDVAQVIPIPGATFVSHEDTALRAVVAATESATAAATPLDAGAETLIPTATTAASAQLLLEPEANFNNSQPVSDETELDSLTLEILGEDPTIEVKYGKDIQKEVAVRLQHITVNGMSKDLKKEISNKYLTPANCNLIDPPMLNAEIKSWHTTDIQTVVKRDKAIEFKQKTLATAISCLADAVTRLLASKDKDPELLRILMDASRLLCDCQHTDSNTRRNFIMSTLKPEMKAQLQSTKIDKYLFGENLQESIKNAKGITKSGNELLGNSNAPKPPQNQTRRPLPPTQARNLNWKGPLPARRPPQAPRTREPAPGTSAGWRPLPPPPPPPPPPPQQRQQTYYRSSNQRHATYRR